MEILNNRRFVLQTSDWQECRARLLTNEVPQELILAPCFFKVYISDIPTTLSTVAIGKPERDVRKSSHCDSKQQRRSRTAITLRARWSLCSIVHKLILAGLPRHDSSIIACSRHVYILLFFAHIPFVVNHAFNATPPERLQHHQTGLR